MRDPKRIPDLLSSLQLAWEMSPDQRLGQFITNIGRDANGSTRDIWSIEDDEWSRLLSAALAKETP